MKKYLPMTTLAIFTCYAPPVFASGAPISISEEEASAFERSLLAQSVAVVKPVTIYTQPVNKVEGCKLPTSQDQIERTNFRSYWDGECKNGFAFGLGRDIAISDTHHQEEIFNHDGTGVQWSNRPFVAYDFVAKMVIYGVYGARYPEITTLSEQFTDTVQGFEAENRLATVDVLGNAFTAVNYAFNPSSLYVSGRINAPIWYRFSDTSAAPRVDPTSSIFMAEIVDARTGVPGGFVIARFPNGTTQHFRVVNGKASTPVTLPAPYTFQIQSKYQEVLNGTSQANSKLQTAASLEREYLFKACNGKSGVKGLDNATYTKICTWRDQFKEPYATASVNYQRKLANMQQQAVSASQQQQIQQQIALQQQLAIQQQALQQRQNSQAASDAGNQILKSSGDFLRSAAQGASSWQPPVVQPITPPGGNNITCYTIGRITRCR